MPDIIYKVFVSSTYEDLREERSELQKALLKLKCLPVGMELFPSADEETWEFISKQIDDSDYYVVIIAGRYGSEAADGISFTEKEYDYARKIGKRTIAFVHGDMKSIPVGKTDTDVAKREKLQKFIEKVRKSPINEYTNPHQLAAHAITSFVDLRERYPATGFIRADESVDQKRHIELLEENARLKEKLSAISADIDEFKDANSIITLSINFQSDQKPASASVSATWKDVFVVIAEGIIDGYSRDLSVEYVLARAFFDKIQPDENKISRVELSTIRRFLVGRRLADVEERTNSFGSLDHYWLLTEYGKQQYGMMKSYAE